MVSMQISVSLWIRFQNLVQRVRGVQAVFIGAKSENLEFAIEGSQITEVLIVVSEVAVH